MIIRDSQLRSLAADRWVTFLRRMRQMLETRFPGWCAARRTEGRRIEDIVKATVDEANGYGVKAESDLELYLQCLAVLGMSFANDPRFPWARGILLRADLTGSAKMDKIYDRVVFGRF